MNKIIPLIFKKNTVRQDILELNGERSIFKSAASNDLTLPYVMMRNKDNLLKNQSFTILS